MRYKLGFIHSPFFRRNGAGFTLIELLIVIAILGILAAGILVAIDPVEQLARSRDSVRISAIRQLSKAMSGYRISNPNYPTQNNTWMTSLVNSGELKNEIQNPKFDPTTPCPFFPLGGSVGSQNGYCYLTDGNAVIYAIAESKSYKQKCSWSPLKIATFMWDSQDDKLGLACDGSYNASWQPPYGL